MDQKVVQYIREKGRLQPPQNDQKLLNEALDVLVLFLS